MAQDPFSHASLSPNAQKKNQMFDLNQILEFLDKVEQNALGLETFKFLLNLCLLLITWTFGTFLLNRWEDKRKVMEIERDIFTDERKRIREINRDMRKQFHELLGEFKSNVRLWEIVKKLNDTFNNQELLETVVRAEGMVEALLSDIASVKILNEEEVTVLGLYRQGYQTLRQAIIKKNCSQKVPATYDTDPYHLFNDVATEVSRIIVEIRKEPDSETARKNYDGVMDVRSDVWEEALKQVKGKKKWNELILAATMKRKEDFVHAERGRETTENKITQ